MASRNMDDVYTVSAIVVDADTMRYGASEFKRVEGTPPTPWAKVVETAKAIRERSERTCKVLHVGTLFDGIEYLLSCGHTTRTSEDEEPTYCSKCGAKVVE